jgi:hypothetical protein
MGLGMACRSFRRIWPMLELRVPPRLFPSRLPTLRLWSPWLLPSGVRTLRLCACEFWWRFRSRHGRGLPRQRRASLDPPCPRSPPKRFGPISRREPPGASRRNRSSQEPEVRIHLLPADSPSLTGSSALRSRTPAVRAGVRAMGGGAVRRDGDRPATWRLPAQCLCRAKFQYRNASDVVQGGRSSCRLAMLRLAQPVKRSRASSVAHPR